MSFVLPMSVQERIVCGVRKLRGDLNIGGCNNVFVAHDPWCDSLKGGSCTCEPDVVFALAQGRFIVDLFGGVKRLEEVAAGGAGA